MHCAHRIQILFLDLLIKIKVIIAITQKMKSNARMHDQCMQCTMHEFLKLRMYALFHSYHNDWLRYALHAFMHFEMHALMHAMHNA